MDNYIMIGSFPLKVEWLAILGSALVSYGLLSLRLKKEQSRKTHLSILLNGVILFWFLWKISYAAIHPLIVFKHPFNLLYFNGGKTGIVLGILGVLVYLLWSANKNVIDRGTLFFSAGLGLSMFFSLYFGAQFGASTVMSDLLIAVFFFVLSVYLFLGQSIQPKKAIFSLLVTSLFFTVLNNLPSADAKKQTSINTLATGLKPGNRAPDFELQSISGKKMRLSDQKGKVVLVNLWATWCPPCRAEMPEMVRFYNENKSEKMEILAVNLTSSDSARDARSFAKDYKLPFPVLLDEEGTVGDVYRTVTIPTTFVVNSDGIIVQKHVGPMSYEMMEEFIKNAN